MSKVLAINSGSSSLKFQLFEMPQEETITSGIVERIGLDDAIFTIKVNGEKISKILPVKDHKVGVHLVLEALIEHKILNNLEEIDAVGHRVVHGGEHYNHSVLFNEEVYNNLVALNEFAPLHNPANLMGYKTFKELLPNVPHTAIFDTAFHQTMKEEFFVYPMPYEFYEKYKVRKYGFHGTSHLYVSRRVAELMDKKPEEINVITLHLGSGASIAAVQNGKCVNTSMGFTPLAGIMMGTRTGDVDPSTIPFLMEKLGKSASEIIDIFNKQSGLKGISGTSGDARDVQQGVDKNDHRSILAQQLFSNRVIQTIGEYFVQMGRVDAIVFTGGIGENDPIMRELILEKCKEALQITYNKELNASIRGKETLLSLNDSKVQVWLIPTNEELVIARDAYSNI